MMKSLMGTCRSGWMVVEEDGEVKKVGERVRREVVGMDKTAQRSQILISPIHTTNKSKKILDTRDPVKVWNQFLTFI